MGVRQDYKLWLFDRAMEGIRQQARGETMEHIDAATLEKIYAYAKRRWCWDDKLFLVELVERHYTAGTSAEDFIDWLADKYELIDPRADWGPGDCEEEEP